MKKIALKTGAILAVGAPVIGAVSCAFVKHDDIEDYVVLPSISKDGKSFANLFADSSAMNNAINNEGGINFAINDSIRAFTNAKSDIFGILPYRDNMNGIIATDGWGKGDVNQFAKLFQALTWYNDRSIINDVFTDNNVNVREENSKVKNFFNRLNIKHGLPLFAQDKFYSAIADKPQELDAWSNSNASDYFISEPHLNQQHTDLVISNNPTKEEQQKLKEHTANEIKTQISWVKDTYIGNNSPLKLNFMPVPGHAQTEPFDFYFYFNKSKEHEAMMNADIKSDYIDYSGVTIGAPTSHEGNNETTPYDIQIKIGSEEYEINLNSFTRFLNAAGIHARLKPTNDLNLLRKVANSNERAFVYMPIDEWAENRKGGSLVLQTRGETTIGDAKFDSNSLKFEAPSIYVDEPTIHHFMEEYSKTFADLFSSDIFDIETVSKCFDSIKNQSATTPSYLTTDKVRNLMALLKSATFFDDNDNLLIKLLTEWDPHERTENYPTVSNGKVEYINPTYYTQYTTKYVVSDYAAKGNETAKLFMNKLGEFGPSLSNGYDWEINAREELPLPIKVGALKWHEEELNHSILAWIKKHFEI